MLKIIKYISIAILSLILVCACANDDVDETPLMQDEISFAVTSGKTTRAASETSLARYIDNFRIYGVKNGSLVFNNYVLWHEKQYSQSNTNNWEYVGIDPVDSKLQTIKYWDYSASPYTFWAIAGADRGQFTPNSDGLVESFTTTLTDNGGSSAVLYYAKPVKVELGSSKQLPVTFQFVGVHSRVRFAFYETVPGYAVKDVKFHIGAGATQFNDCYVNGAFSTAGSLTLSYSSLDTNNPQVGIDLASSETSGSHSFGTLNYTKAASGTLSTTPDACYLGVMSSAPTYAGNPENPGYYTSILPFTANTTPLTITVDYTLVSLDGSGQEIEITGATATVPAQFCQWRSNYSYTYLFKITDSDLKPITFVAYGENDNTTDNQQGTITTVDEYSITTHQKGDTDENGIAYESSPYVTERPIEISVVKGDGSEKPTLEGKTDFVRIYHQTTANEWIVETYTSDPVTSITYSNGKASFTPSETGTYRIEYWHKDEEERRAVKIVAIGAKLDSTGHTGTDLDDGGNSDFNLKENN